MKIHVVYHLIHVQTPYKYQAKLFITGIPDEVKPPEVAKTLTRAGYWFGEFDIEWANHYTEEFDSSSHDQLWRSWNTGDVERITWTTLRDLAGLTTSEFTKRKVQVCDELDKCTEEEVVEQIAALLGV